MPGDNAERVAAAYAGDAHSPENVVPAAMKAGSAGGSSVCITTHDTDGRAWGSSRVDTRRRAYRHILEGYPRVIARSVMCRGVRSMVHANYPRMSAHDKSRRLQEAGGHLEFASPFAD